MDAGFIIDKEKYPNCYAGHEYAINIVEGWIDACKWTKMACQRFLDDIERSQGDWPYHLDLAKAERALFAIQLFPNIKGPLAGKPLKLIPWQKFIYLNIFGWVHKETGMRRFRRSYTEVPRGNGKSAMSAPLGLYGLAMDEEGGAEVYSAATTRDQAKIVFKDAQNMARRTPGFLKKFGVDVHAHNISQVSSASKFEPLSADGNTLDGLNIHIGIVDELHAHKTREVYDVLETGTGKRLQSLLWSITTAGTNMSGICYEVRTYCTKVLQGIVEDDSQFAIIYTIDDEDDWTDSKNWVKANPNWGVSVMPEVIEQLAKKAMQTPSAVNNFLTKHLNRWVNADRAWMDMIAWGKCADPTLKLEDFEGKSCFIGLDLATKTDIAAKVRLFPRRVNDQTHYYLFGEYYLPEETVKTSDNSQYEGWERTGLLTTTPGEVTDFNQIEREIIDDSKRFDVREVPFDPWQATQLAQNLADEGIEMVEYRMTTQNLSEPMKEFEALVKSGRLHHDGSPVMTWMMSNVVCHEDNNGNVFPKKENKNNKIDGPVAAIMCLGRAMLDDDESGGGSVYDNDDLWEQMDKIMGM